MLPNLASLMFQINVYLVKHGGSDVTIMRGTIDCLEHLCSREGHTFSPGACVVSAYLAAGPIHVNF